MTSFSDGNEPSFRMQDASPGGAEKALYQRAERVTSLAASYIVPLLSCATSLVGRRLSGKASHPSDSFCASEVMPFKHSSAGTATEETWLCAARSSKSSRVWLGLCLWLVICIGELGWLNQSSLSLWLWVALFALPRLYVTSRTALDALVDDSLAFVLSAVHGGERTHTLPSMMLLLCLR